MQKRASCLALSNTLKRNRRDEQHNNLCHLEEPSVVPNITSPFSDLTKYLFSESINVYKSSKSIVCCISNCLISDKSWIPQKGRICSCLPEIIGRGILDV